MALQQAFHLENGFWTTRHENTREAIVRNSEGHNERPSESEHAKPKLGLLSQTVIATPTIQLVLPARVRSRRLNDVVFVGETSIQLREVIMDTYLEDVMTKSDFDANIIAAKAVQTYRELPLDVQMRLGAQRESPDNLPEAESSLPGHLLVFTLDSNELVFLYYNTEPSLGDGHFVHYRRPMPSDINVLERFGQHLAVDPKSRAVAVAAPADFFGVFLLKSCDELQSQMTEGTLNPIAEERFFRLDGDILFMEFLFPEPENESRIILLLLVAKGSETLAISYDWDSSETLRRTRPRILMRNLPADCRLPHILVPLTKATSFLLITSTFMVIYRNVLDPSTKVPIRLRVHNPPSEPGYSPLWARWARPYRNSMYTKSHDDIYLCREDGFLMYIDISNTGEIDNQTELGQLDCDVDAAFDTINFSDLNQGGDLLLAAGNMGHGGLFVQRAREHPVCVQKFMNWAPVMDVVVVPPHSRNRNRVEGTPEDEGISGDRLCVCSGSSGNRGVVFELRYGFEARVGLVVPLEHLSSTRSIWTIPDPVDGGVYLLASDPVSSTLLYLSQDVGEEIFTLDDSQSTFDSSSHTLAAGSISFGILVQITDNSIRLVAPKDSSMNLVSSFQSGETVFASTFNGEHALVATAHRSDQLMHLRVNKILCVDGACQVEPVGHVAEIDYEPISMLVKDLGGEVYMFVGTSDGRLVLYHVGSEGLSYLGSHLLNLNGDAVSRAIESMALVSTGQKDGRQCTRVFCGLRSGVLVPLSIIFDNEGQGTQTAIYQESVRRLGQTAVKLTSDVTREDHILATCGERFWCLEVGDSSDASKFFLQQVWITDQSNSSYVQKSIDVFTMIDGLPNSLNSLTGSLVCISDGQLFVCTLDWYTKSVPRKIDIPGAANRIAYSRHLGSLVVAYTTTELKSDAVTGVVKRTIRPHIDFVDLDNFQLDPSSNSGPNLSAAELSRPWRPSGAAGERITCVLDWTPKRDGEEYHFIIIGTARRNQENNGRVIFLQAQRNPTGPERVKCSVKHIHKFEGPVRAVAAYGEYTLMVATGYDIVPLEPKFSEKRWVRAARFRLTSPGVSITVRENILYVTTARDSLVVLQVVDDKLELYAHDGVKREGLSHHHIGGEAKLVLATSRGGTVSALSEIGVTWSDQTISPAVAEAHLPRSIIRLSSCSTPSALPSSTVVYGTTMDGAVYRIMTLTEKEWRLLRLIQNLCAKDLTVSPFLSARKRRWTWADIAPTSTKPSKMHVNGDVLARLLKHGPDLLRRMLTSDANSLSSDAAVLPPKTYMELFLGIYGELFEQTSDPISEVMDWLDKLLQLGF